jgi:hypothetical protein
VTTTILHGFKGMDREIKSDRAQQIRKRLAILAIAPDRDDAADSFYAAVIWSAGPCDRRSAVWRAAISRPRGTGRWHDALAGREHDSAVPSPARD